MAAVAAVSWLFSTWLRVANAATVSTALLLVVLLVAATSPLWVAVTTSVVAMLAFNIAFLPPVGTLIIADPQNWVALSAFLAVSLVASNLSAVARARTDEALSRRDELARLFDLSRDVLMSTETARRWRRWRGRWPGASTCRRSPSRCRAATTGTSTMPAPRCALDTRELASAFAAAQTTLEFDAYARTYAGHRTMQSDDGRTVRLVPLRVGTRPIGLLAAAGRPVEPGTLDALAGVVAIGIERAHLLEERKTGELTRQSEQLKTALLASLGHDLRTPLTAIRVAAANLQAARSPSGAPEQSELIQAEVERLHRLFQNILEMARLDAGGVATEPRSTHPSEIVAAARDQVEQALRQHVVAVTTEPDEPVRLDPRLTAVGARARARERRAVLAGGLAHRHRRLATTAGLTVSVRDHGPGLAPADLPRLFERFYRGDASRARISGTGMGLWIARGLLAVQGGRVWAENCPDGGARFTMVVPPAATGGAGPRVAPTTDRRPAHPARRRRTGDPARRRAAAAQPRLSGRGRRHRRRSARARGRPLARPGRARPRPARHRGDRGLPAHPARPRRCRSSCCRRAAPRPTRYRRSTWAPTTT